MNDPYMATESVPGTGTSRVCDAEDFMSHELAVESELYLAMTTPLFSQKQGGGSILSKLK